MVCDLRVQGKVEMFKLREGAGTDLQTSSFIGVSIITSTTRQGLRPALRSDIGHRAACSRAAVLRAGWLLVANVQGD